MDDDALLRGVRETRFLGDTTKRMYLSKIEEIRAAVFPAAKSRLSRLLESPEAFGEALDRFCERGGAREGAKPRGRQARDGSLGAHTKQSYVTAVMALFRYNQDLRETRKDLFDRWVQVQDKVSAPIEHKYLSNRPTDRQRAAYLDFAAVEKIRDALPVDSPTRLLLCLSTKIPPMRSDFFRTKIYETEPSDEPETENYVVLKPPSIVLRKYKTARTYGRLDVPMPPDLVDDIRASLRASPRDYLFVSPRTKEPFRDANAYNRWANRALLAATNMAGFSISMLRHLYISRPDLALKSKSGLEREQVARCMGHSVQTQERYYWMEDDDD